MTSPSEKEERVSPVSTEGTEGPPRKDADKQRRLAKALRENLLKRKVQQRSRET